MNIKIFIFVILIPLFLYLFVSPVIHENNERNFCLEKYDSFLELDSKWEIDGIYCKNYYEKIIKFEKEYKKDREEEKKQIQNINNYIKQ